MNITGRHHSVGQNCHVEIDLMEHGSNMFKHITMINSETYVGTC
jgi:hypothetical protein